MSNTYKTYFKSFYKYCIHLKFPIPSEYEISSYSKHYIKKNNINISEINLIRIQNYFPPNFKKISEILDLIQIYININKKFNLIPIQQIIKNNSSDLDIDIYQSTYQLLSEPCTVKKCGSIMSKDTKYISLLLHTNMANYIHYNTNYSFEESLHIFLKFNTYVPVFIYNYINYTLSCYSNNILNNKHKKEYCSHSNVIKSPVISKLNYKYCNIKYIREICNHLEINIYSFQVFAHYLYYLFSKYKVKKYKKNLLFLINYYQLTYKEIDKIFKLIYIQKLKIKLIDYPNIYKLIMEE